LAPVPLVAPTLPPGGPISLCQQYLFYLIFCLFSVDARIPVGSLNLSLLELACVAFAACVLMFPRGAVPRHLVAVGVALFAGFSFSMMLHSEIMASFAYVRSVTVAVIAVLAMYLFRPDLNEFTNAMKCLAIFGGMCAVLGWMQATFGTTATVVITDIFPPVSDYGQERWDWTSDWKLTQIRQHLPGINLVALARGLHQNPQNFGEAMMYAFVAAMWLSVSRPRRLMWMSICAVCLTVILISGARTILFLAILLFGFAIFSRARNLRMPLLFAIVALAVLFLGQFLQVMRFDGFGTVAGRFALNSAAFELLNNQPHILLVGGGYVEFVIKNGFAPHNVFLAGTLAFGVLNLALVLVFVGLVASAARRNRNQVGLRGAFLDIFPAMCLMVGLYAMTTSFIDSAHSNIMLLVTLSAIANLRPATPGRPR